MKKEAIIDIRDRIMDDVNKGKWVRIVGDMSKDNATLIIRNMVHSDISANVLYGGFSKKSFNKLIDLLYKEDGIVINPSCCPHLYLQDVTIHLI